MRVISEEEIKAIFLEIQKENYTESILEDKLISACKELNDWKPIDENTPKDRRIMLFYEKYGMHTGEFRCGHYLADAGLCVPCNIKPKYWQELPPLPKE